SKLQQFVLLPPRGMTTRSTASNPDLTSFLVSLGTTDGTVKVRGLAKGRKGRNGGSEIEMRVLDSIHDDGAKLVEMSPNTIADLRAIQPGMRIVPVVYYYPAVAPPPKIETPVKTARAIITKIILKVVSRTDGKPVAGASVVAFTDFAARAGAQGVTNSNGEVSLSLGGLSKKLQRLYILPKLGFWGLLKKNITVTSGQQLGLRPIDLSFTDSKRFFYGDAPEGAGAGIKVGV